MDANGNIIDPTGAEQTPRAAETESHAEPATAPLSVEEQEIANLQTTIASETATPEEKEQARIGYSLRVEAREAKQRAHDAEIQAAEERGRRLALEGTAPVPGSGAAPHQAEPLPLPGPVLPPEPKLSDYTKTDEDGFIVEDTERFTKDRTDWAADVAVKRYAWQKEQEALAQRRSEWQRKGEEQTPGFMQKVDTLGKNLSGPNAAPIGIAITQSDMSHELVKYLADNPGEVRRLSTVDVHVALMELGALSVRLREIKARSQGTTNAPNPGSPLKPTTSVENFDPLKADATTYGLKHPACPEWMKGRQG